MMYVFDQAWSKQEQKRDDNSLDKGVESDAIKTLI